MEAFISQTQVSYEFPNEIVYEKKLDTALRDTFLASFEERYKDEKMSSLDKVMLSHIPAHLRQEIWDKSPTYMGYIMRDILSLKSNSITEKASRRQHSILMDALILVVEIQLMNMLKNYEATNKRLLVEKIQNRLRAYDIPLEVRALVHLSSWLTTVLDRGARCRRRQGKMSEEDYVKYLTSNSKYIYEELSMIVIFGEKINILILGQKIWVMPYAGITLIQNKISDTISVLLFAYFAQGTSLPQDAYSVTLAFIRELATLLREFKNKYFTIAKSLESICIAESIQQHEDWVNSEFLRVTANDMYEDIGFDYMGSKLREHLTEVDTPMRHQLCCLGKLLGHPYVNMRGGAEALHKKTTEAYNLNLKAINDCMSHIKLNYIRNHVLRHKRWPPCSIAYGASLALTQAFIRQKDPYDKYIVKLYGSIHLDDMNFVTLEKNDRFYKLENVIPYLKDKTITLLKSRVLSAVLDPTSDEESPRWEETRLLLAYLLNPSLVHNHVDYIDKYEGSSDLEEFLDYLVIRIVPKEKELKIDFRGFGCKTYEDRFRSLAQEKNAMRFLDDYSDEQAMTLSELEILRRLNTFRNLYRAYPGHKMVYINIDAQAWNNHFRKETVDDPMKETLDRIFGTSIYGKTHAAYEKTFFYVPGYPETFHWQGQGGGIEGLNQDTWVIIYLGQIKTALDGLGFKYHCLCKGDDLRIAVAVPPHVWKNREMVDIKNDIVTRLAKTMSSFGHKIKVMESYGSSKYFCFSKNASIESIELPQGFRKIQKCYGASNALIATLDEYIASTFSNAHSTCKVEPNVLPAYVVALYWSLTYLITHPTYKMLTSDELAGLLLVPSLAGGFPIIYLHNMPIRAESDLLSPFLEIYRFACQHYPCVGRVIQNFLYAPVRSKADDHSMLYHDPYSIPHSRPALPSAVLRRFIIPVLKRYAKQEDVKELLAAAGSIEMQTIKQVLETASVFNAKIQSALYSSTPEGILNELTRKFESARSINELMIRSVGMYKSMQNLRKVIRAERKVQIWRSNRVKGKHDPGEVEYSHLISECPAESADRVREYLWGRKIVGVTMPPMQHQVIFMTAFSITENKWINENHFTYSISDREKSIDNEKTDHYSSGKFKPFLGYSTRNGMTEPTVHFLEKDPMLLKIKNLLDLVTWTNISAVQSDGSVLVSNCPDLIKLILGSYTPTPLSDLAPFSGIRRSGTIQHHVRAPNFREAIVPNVLSNVYTRVLGESNTHIRYRTSKHHYYVNFLHVYCYSVWMSMLELEMDPYSSVPEKIWAVSSACDFCNRMIIDEPIIYNMDLVRGMTLHPLAVSRVGQVAESILKQSLDAAKDITYNVDDRIEGELPRAVAYQGVLQEIMEQTYLSRISLQTRYETQTLSDDAYQVLVNLIPQNRSRDVGQSEIKRIPIYDLAVYISIIILHFSGKLRGKGLANDRSAALSSTPGESLPWYGLIHQIHRAGLLPKLVLHFSKFLGTPHATCFYNPVTASRFLCRYAPLLIRYLKPDRPLVVLSYYTVSHLTYVIELLISEKVLLALKTDYLRYMPTSMNACRVITPAQKEDLLELFRESLVLAAILYNLDIIAGEMSAVVSEHKYKSMRGFGIEFLTPTMIDDFLSDTEGYTIEVTEWLSKWSKLGFDDLGRIRDSDWETILMNVQRRYEASSYDIHYTNVGACCLIVRSAIGDDSDESSDPARLPFQQLPHDPDQIQMNGMDKPCLITTGIDYTEPALRGHISAELPSLGLTCIPIHEAFCTLGAAAGSETNLLYILYNQGLAKHVSNPAMNATCFADGYGGFISVLDELVRDLTVIFHTIPQDTESPVLVPVLELNQGSSVVLTAHLDEGYHDLTLWSTFDRMMSYGQANDLVTSDLELSVDQYHTHLDINLNIIRYYLQTRTRLCQLIIKLSMDKPRDIGTLHDVCLHFCLFVCLHSPRSNDSSKYVYLIAKGWRKSYDELTIRNIVTGGISDHSTTVINRYFKQVMSQWRRFSRLLVTGLDLGGCDCGFRSHPSFKFLYIQDRLPSLLLSEFDFSIIMSELEGVEGSCAWRNRMLDIFLDESGDSRVRIEKALDIDTNKYLASLWDDLDHGELSHLAVHRHAVICRIMKIVAFRKTVSSFIGFMSPIVIRRDELQSALAALFNRLAPRDQFGYSQPLCLDEADRSYEGIDIHYMGSYRRGIAIGLVLLGTVSMYMREPGKKQQIDDKLRRVDE